MWFAGAIDNSSSNLRSHCRAGCRRLTTDVWQFVSLSSKQNLMRAWLQILAIVNDSMWPGCLTRIVLFTFAVTNIATATYWKDSLHVNVCDCLQRSEDCYQRDNSLQPGTHYLVSVAEHIITKHVAYRGGPGTPSTVLHPIPTVTAASSNSWPLS
jgi:hypothetical protein